MGSISEDSAGFSRGPITQLGSVSEGTGLISSGAHCPASISLCLLLGPISQLGSLTFLYQQLVQPVNTLPGVPVDVIGWVTEVQTQMIHKILHLGEMC